jgi:hypothetical protein
VGYIGSFAASRLKRTSAQYRVERYIVFTRLRGAPTSNLHQSPYQFKHIPHQAHPHVLLHRLTMTDTLPYDRRGSYSILHNHLRAYEQARLQKLADGKGNEAARARMRIANLNLQADAARRVRQDSDITLVAGNAPKKAELFEDSETEGEDDTLVEREKGTDCAVAETKASIREALVVQKEATPSKKEKKGGRRKSVKDKMAKVSFTAFSGYVPKRKGPEFAIYPI